MNRRLVLAIGLLTTMSVLAPIGSAGWRSWVYETHAEPNTNPDTDAGYLWADAATAGVDRIYFDANVIESQAGGPFLPLPTPPGFSPRPYGLMSFHAYLGYWRDCNLDGFVGDALTGGDHYLLLELPAGSPCAAGGGGLYWDGLFAQEMLAIGPNANEELQGTIASTVCGEADVCATGGANFVRDDFAKVWYDHGIPSDRPGVSRLLLPFPQGTMSDTNGHFKYVDGLTFGSLERCDDGNFDDLCWAWPTHQATYVDGNGRQRAVGNQCDADPVTNVQEGINQNDPLAGNGCSPIPNLDDPVTSTVRDRWNDSNQASGQCLSEGSAVIKPWEWGDRCDRLPAGDECTLKEDVGVGDANLNGALYPTLDHIYRSAAHDCSNGPPLPTAPPVLYSNMEAPDNPIVGGGSLKVQSDSWMLFTEDYYYNPSANGGPDQEVCASVFNDPVDLTGHALGPFSADDGMPTRCGGTWFSVATWLTGLGVTTLNPVPFATQVNTFYADVNFAAPAGFGSNRYEAPTGLADDASTALPAGGNDARTYGAEQCPTGPNTRWNCAPAAWIPAAVTDPEARYLLSKVGDAYDLRDVECRDSDTPAGPNPLATRDCENLPVVFSHV